jgi:sulfotransferase
MEPLSLTPDIFEGTLTSKAHFISGLPRSGSTLLAALLRQNPRFSAGMSSPVYALCATAHQKMCGGEFGVFFDDARRSTVLRGLVDSYYNDIPAGNVLFDTNRSWTGRASLLGELYPESRIICCVREIGWVIDSVESMLNKNPLQLSRIFKSQAGNSVYSRVEVLMNSEQGLIGRPWANLREAWFGAEAKRLIVINYESLARNPKQVLERLYQEIGEAPFTHDFQNVDYDEPDYDSLLGMPGLHKVREKVEYRERKPCIPPDIFKKYAGSNFWTQPELNQKGVLVL